MAWPPTLTGTGTATGLSGSGKTTIRWGTEGLLQTPHPTSGYYTVIRFSERPLIDNQKLPNGNGVTATRLLIMDGVEFDITVRDDTNMTPPVPGGSITIVDAAGLLGTVGQAYSATVVDANYDTAIKQAGERVIRSENLILVDSQTGAAQS